MEKLLLILALMVVFILSFSCENNIEIQLTRTEWEEVDTLYIRQVDTLKAFTDSMCDVMTAIKLQSVVDSIITVRKLEAEALKARTRN